MLDVNSLLCVTSVLYLSNVLQMSLKKIKTVLKNREKRLKALYIIINTTKTILLRWNLINLIQATSEATYFCTIRKYFKKETE